MALSFSLTNFPQDGAIKDSSGLPWGCCLQPLSPIETEPNGQKNEEKELIQADSIARCEECFAYINPYATFQREKWRCSLCGCPNALKTNDPRYSSLVSRATLPELKERLIEYQMESTSTDQYEFPVFLAIVDITGEKGELDLIKKGLLAALEALPPSSFFGLVTFSDRIGIYDLNSSIPHVLHIQVHALPPSKIGAIVNPGRTTDCSLGIEDIFNNSKLFVQIESNMNKITLAIESLRCVTVADMTIIKKRAFGTTIHAVLDYVCEFSEFKHANFLCGMPNYGKGNLVAPSSGTHDIDKDLSPQTAFYKDEALRASEAGICIDIYVVSPTNKYIGLSSIKFLSLMTGGNIMLYDNVETATLPQDMYRQLNAPFAFDGLLRIRTSSAYKSSHSFGHLFPDKNYENLYHLPGCDQYKTFAFDFEFSSPNGFTGDVDSTPTLQVAFAYTILPPNSKTVQRRLRVHTYQVGVATTPEELYYGANPDTILCLLTHKIIRSSLDDGIAEGRLLIQDWLTILIRHYNENIFPSSGQKKGVPRQMDTSFTKFTNLRNLSRLVFALTKCPMMSAVHPCDADYWSYLHCLYSGLEPKSLHKALYPVMHSYGAVNNLASQNLFLSRSSVVTSGCRIFLVDAYSMIIVYYTDSQPEIPFPPPKDSLVKTTINSLKQDRHVTPKIIYIKAGSKSPDEPLFDLLLIEESNKYGPSYPQFLEYIQMEVAKLS